MGVACFDCHANGGTNGARSKGIKRVRQSRCDNSRRVMKMAIVE
jgi:hypothetical protein